MRIRKITYPFLVQRYFNILKFKYVDLPTVQDSMYGEFIFFNKNIPSYYYCCFDEQGDSKKEIPALRSL